MPKLSKQLVKDVKNAEAASGSYLIPEGRYAAQLRSIITKDGEKAEYLVWEFHNLHDSEGNPKPGRQWNNTSLSPKALGFLKATFEAFGYEPAESEDLADELVGEWVVLYVIQETIGKGPKAGQLRNSVQSLAEFVPDEWDFDPADVASGGSKDSDDEY